MVKLKRYNYPKANLSIDIEIGEVASMFGRLAEEETDVRIARASYEVARRRNPRDTRSQRAFKKYDHLLRCQRRKKL